MLDALRLYTHSMPCLCLVCKAPRLLNGQGGEIWTTKFSYPPPHILATQKFFAFLRKYSDNLYLYLASHALHATSPVSTIFVQHAVSLMSFVFSLIATVSVPSVFNLLATPLVSNIFVQRATVSVPSVPSVPSVYLMANLRAPVSVSNLLTTLRVSYSAYSACSVLGAHSVS